jgi:hypothetical protein
MRYGLYDIYCSAHRDQCSLIIRSFWLHGVVGADLRPDSSYPIHLLLAGKPCVGCRSQGDCCLHLRYTCVLLAGRPYVGYRSRRAQQMASCTFVSSCLLLAGRPHIDERHKFWHCVISIGRRVRACTRLSVAAKTLTTRDHVRAISGPSTLFNTYRLPFATDIPQ